MAQEGGRLDGAEGVRAGLMCCACCSLCSVGRGKHAIAVAACTVAAAHLLYRYAPRISQLGIGGAESWGRARRVPMMHDDDVRNAALRTECGGWGGRSGAC